MNKYKYVKDKFNLYLNSLKLKVKVEIVVWTDYIVLVNITVHTQAGLSWWFMRLFHQATVRKLCTNIQVCFSSSPTLSLCLI